MRVIYFLIIVRVCFAYLSFELTNGIVFKKMFPSDFYVLVSYFSMQLLQLREITTETIFIKATARKNKEFRIFVEKIPEALVFVLQSFILELFKRVYFSAVSHLIIDPCTGTV